MSPDTPELLLERLRLGELRASDLTGEQFQEILFRRFIEVCRKQTGFEYELLDDYHGAVDFVVREKPQQMSPFHVADPVHMFECKNYARTLELSTVAKLLVVGVRFQPNSLNIVSRTSLQPQVLDYARILFCGLGNQTPMFRQTLFRHYLTSELLDIELGESSETGSEISTVEGAAKQLDISWELIESRPFTESLLASSAARHTQISIDTRWQYRLRVYVLTLGDPHLMKVSLEGLPAAISVQTRAPVINRLETRWHVDVMFALDPRNLVDPTLLSLVVNVLCGSRKHWVHTLSVLVKPHDSSGHAYPNLRERNVEELIQWLRARPAPRLLFLGGGAGVGKTHMCEMVAETLRATGAFDIDRFTAEPDWDTEFLKTVFLTVCTPAVARSDAPDSWKELAGTILSALSPMCDSASGIEQQPIDVIIPVLAEILVRGGPRLLILRDMHRLGERAARELRILIGRLDDLGWGDVYCILEYRTPEEPQNRHWKQLKDDLRSRVNECLQYQLEPLTRGDVNRFLDGRFQYITEELKAAFWDMCGGVPLYIFSLLEVLDKRLRAIKRLEGNIWEISRPSEFLRPRLSGKRTEAILQERLRAISWTATVISDDFRANPEVLLALFAIANTGHRVQRLCDLLGVSPQVRRSFHRTLLRNGIVRQSGTDLDFDFQHELLRQTAIAIGFEGGGAQAAIERTLAAITDGTADALDLELCADLASWAGFKDDATRALNAAFERVRASPDLGLIHRILRKLRESLQDTALKSPKQYLEQVSCRSALAWATWNTGSFLEARDEYRTLVADLRTQPADLIDPHTAEALAADSQRRVVGLDLHLEDFEGFVASAKTALGLDGHSIAFHSVMNRLVLYCGAASHVEMALDLARRSLLVFGDPEPESAGAVICSDIGAIYRAADPQRAQLLYEQGVSLAMGARQRLHNELDVFITDAATGRKEVTDEEIDSKRKVLASHGLRSMVTRIDFFRAARSLRRGRLNEAKALYAHVNTCAAIYRYHDLRLPLWNDLLILSLLSGDHASAQHVVKLIDSHLTARLESRTAILSEILAFLPLIDRQVQRFGNLKPLAIRIPEGVPSYSGALIQVLLNLQALLPVVNSEVRDVLAHTLNFWPDDIDRQAASEQFARQPAAIRFRGIGLALCAQ